MESIMLRDGVKSLELTTKVTLATLATASGVYTYLGVRQLLDGEPTMIFFAAIIYSAAVSVGIYTFWSFLMRFMPHVRDNISRGLLMITILIGSAMIVAMSSWLNATALAGSAALEQHLANKLEAYVEDLDRAHNNALAAQSLLPDIQMTSLRFTRLAEDEETRGSLTGTAGSGTVVQLLAQMAAQLDGLGREVTASAERVGTLYQQGGEHLASMRELVSSRGPITARSDAFGSEAMALMGVIASLQQTSVAPSVQRAAEDLSRGFVAPVAGGLTADLAQRQTRVVGNVESAVAEQSAALAQAAGQIMSMPQVVPERYEPLSTATAVIRYARDFLPSWAGAISIDLLPAVLIFILCVVHAGIRREGAPVADATTMSAADLLAARRILREVEAADALPDEAPDRKDERSTDGDDGIVTPLNRGGAKE
jgi:hypothetical protein